MSAADVVIVGGGIVGLATAYQLTRRDPPPRVIVLEKEAELAGHQTGHNSGVIHSGVYYKPGSLKATTCRAGKAALEEFCTVESIPFEICGKVIVAVDDSELPALARIHERAVGNGVRCEPIGPERLRDLEPHAAGVRALHVPETGIVDYKLVCRRLADRIRERGGEILTRMRVTSIKRSNERAVVHTTATDFETHAVVTCAGLFSDRVTRLSGQDPTARIVPFRGEYYELKPSAWRFCRNLIYPVPDPKFPFLGVHFTRVIGDGVECGPNAVLAFAREGYRWSDISIADLTETLSYPGFLRLARKYWRMGLGEVYRSISKAAFVRALQRLVPDIRAEDLHAAPAGVRAQAVCPDGTLMDDFLVREGDRVVNVVNAVSPAATASLAIGRYVADRVIAGPLDRA
ncbi:MAG TPA: L-2-hydroxyglutarate oxidase [Gemmataceae bacterium]|nr:L-2-hydroxyglutarate oxidase [Gemmataceae bacterium]